MEIYQLLPGLHAGDAISNHALALKRLLRSWGHEAEIFAKDISYDVSNECRSYKDFSIPPDGLTIYHYSLGSSELTDRFLSSRGKRLLIYHNITPHHYLESYNKDLCDSCRRGREQLAELSQHVDMAVGDSPFNCRELAEHGFRSPRVLPLLLDFPEFAAMRPCPTVLRRFDDGWINFLFVGRLCPNKCQDDVIRAFAKYQRRIERRARLFLIGGAPRATGFVDQLQAVAREYEVADHVFFPGHVRREELAAYYQLASVFVCMSEHEGFCVPLLEAMCHDVPVLAYAAAAVPQTLGTAGILVTKKDHALIAELAHLLVSDHDLRTRVLRRQQSRLQDFCPESIAEQFRTYVDELIQT